MTCAMIRSALSLEPIFAKSIILFSGAAQTTLSIEPNHDFPPLLFSPSIFLQTLSQSTYSFLQSRPSRLLSVWTWWASRSQQLPHSLKRSPSRFPFYYFFPSLNFKLNTRFENIGGRLVQIPKTRLGFLILDSAPKLLKNTNRLVVLLQLLLSHHYTRHQLTVRLRLQVALNIILNEFPQFRPVQSSTNSPQNYFVLSPKKTTVY